MRLSKYQKNFCAAVAALARGELVEGKRHIVLDAKAGSGKTFVICKSMECIPTTQRVIAVMFNKRNADDIQPKLPQTGNCRGMTTHSLGNRALSSALRTRPRLDDTKVSRILEGIQMSLPERLLKGQIKKMAGIAKALGIVPKGYVGAYPLVADNSETWTKIIDKYAIEFNEDWEEEAAIGHVRTVLKLSLDQVGERNGVIDFSDMLYVPTVMRMPFPKYDWLYIDESQDISPIQREMVKRAVAPTGHLIAVGDPNQACYGFRAADSESMQKIKEEMDAHEMPLSICYRCDKAIIKEAKTIVPAIEWQEGRAEGQVTHGIDVAQKWAVFTPDCAILCPYNAPLVKLACRLMRHRIACRVLGRDFSAGMVKLLQRLQADTARDADEKLTEYFQDECDRLKDKETQLQQLEDKVEALRAFLEDAPSNEKIERVIASIEALFAEGEEKGMVTLSTIHKAKGGQWPHVFLMDSHVLGYTTAGRPPRVRNLLPWEIQQRRNLLYVGITRAQNWLSYITSEEIERLQ